MKQEDIAIILLNINYAGSAYKELYELKSKLKNFQSELEKEKKKLDNLNYSTINIEQKILIKRTFDQILDEICKENNINREKLFVEFEEKICGGYFFRKDETKVETIKKEINAWGDFTFKFSIASNKAALEQNPIFCIYPLTEKEKARRKKVKELRQKDPLYSEYKFNVKPFSPMSDGTLLYEVLEREEGISAEMAWFFNISKFENMYYYVEPKYIDLDDESILSKALKNMLTDKELTEYYTQKKEYKELIEKRKQEIKETKEIVEDLKKEIAKLNLEIDKKERFIERLEWPIIKINVGDFVEEIYASDDTVINKSNSTVEFYVNKYKPNITEKDKDTFTLSINMHENKNLTFNTDIICKMPYSEKMYDGKTLYEHMKRSRKKSITKLKKMKDIAFYFNPVYFFKYIDQRDILKDSTVQKIVLKCIALEIARNEKKPKSYAEQIYEKYVKELAIKKPQKPQEKKQIEHAEKPSLNKNEVNSKEDVLKTVREDCNNFKNLDIKHRSIKEIALEAVIMDGLLLKYVSEDLKDDDEIVSIALEQNPMALEFASNRIKNEESVVLDVVSSCGDAITFASPKLKNTKDIVLAAIKNDGMALRHIPNFNSDREIVLEAVKQNGRAVVHSDKKFFADKEIMLKVIKQPQSAYLIMFASELWDDMDVMVAAQSINKEYIKYASDRIKYEFGRLEDEYRVDFIESFTSGILNTEDDLKHKSKTKIKTRR